MLAWLVQSSRLVRYGAAPVLALWPQRGKPQRGKPYVSYAVPGGCPAVTAPLRSSKGRQLRSAHPLHSSRVDTAVTRATVCQLQVLRYGPTNKYGAHIDGLERVATVLMYLVGELARGWSCCCYGALSCALGLVA